MGDLDGEVLVADEVLVAAQRVRAAADRLEAEVNVFRAAADRVRAATDELQAAKNAVPVAADRVNAAEEGLLDAENNFRGAEAPLRTAGDGIIIAAGRVPVSVDKNVFAYKEIANLLNIKEDPVHKLALKEWQRKEKDLSNRVSRRESRSADLTNQIFNIIGWYAVFQGVVLTAVSQLTQTITTGGLPLCGKIWFPIVLTGFATLVTIAGISYKFKSLRSLEQTIQTEKQISREVARRATNLRRLGPKRFRFSEHASNSLSNTQPKSFWNNWIPVILSLIIFTGIFILSYFVILCDTWVVRKWDGGLHG